MSELKLLSDRIKNLTTGLLGMADSGTTQVSKAFLESVREYMVELLELRRTQPDQLPDPTKLMPDNAPLTLEELRGMDGPVWVCYQQETWGPQHPNADNLTCSRYKFTFDNYGKTWLAYRRKKEDV